MQDTLLSDTKIIDLPTFTSPFIGRTYHIQSIVSLLREEGKRLITLFGPGGMGKTRLSVNIGETMIDDFKHGVCFVALDMVTDPEQVPLYIGHRLGLRAGSRGDWTAAIITFLRDKQLLLILDNLEQILDAAPVIARILDTCPRMNVLATSREILDLPHEVEYPLDSLNRPNPKLFPSPEELMRFDAIDLFVQKARSSRPNFQLTEANATAVVQICHLLDGLPLPIELAAARIKLFSPELILTKLQSNGDLLKTKARGVVPRHQNIRQTIQWSYDLLDEDEQQLFQQLALFRGGFSLESLGKILPEQDALEAIESFVNKSLIVKAKEISGVPRFRMLKLIRDYGLEQLQDNPKSKIYQQRFADYYLTFAEEMETQVRSTAPTKWTALMEAEYENLELALEWLAANHPDQAARLGAAFWRFHLSRGFLREGLDLIEKLLTLPISDKATGARLLEGAGTLSHNLGKHREAKAFFLRCLELRQAGAEQELIIKALNNVAWSEWRLGNYDRTIAYSEEALERSRQSGNSQTEATSLNNIAWIYFYRGLVERAEDLQRQILAIRTRLEDLKGIAFAWANLSWALIKAGKSPEANQLIDQAIATFEDLKNQQLLAFSQMIKAEYYFASGDTAAARTLLLEHCLPSFEKISDSWGIAQCHYWLGRIQMIENDLETAHPHLFRSMALFRNSQDKYGLALTSFWWSRLCWESEEAAAAGEALQHSLTPAAEMKVNDLLRDGHLEQARRAVHQQDFRAGLQYLAIADYYAEKLGSYQYQQFSTKIAPLLEPPRAFLTSEAVDLSAIPADRSQAIDDHLHDGSLNMEQLEDRLHQLFHLTSPASSTATDAGKKEEADAATVPETEDPFVLRVHQTVEDHLQDAKLSVNDLCQELHVSHSQLHRRLSAATGLSTSKFIRAVRLEKARELLRDPELTIAAVAYDSGFRDVDYFYRVFKQESGMTPGEFRERHSNAG